MIKTKYEPFYIISIVLSALYVLKFNLIIGENILSSYPYISNDGFDWYVEGLYLIQLIQYRDLYENVLPVLRPPIFVLICAIDVLLGQRGFFISMVYGVASCLTFIFLVILYKLIAKTQKIERNNFSIYLILIGITLSPINYVKVYLLSDTITVCLSAASILYLYKYHLIKNTKFIFIALTCAIVSSLTQTYGFLPFIICSFIFFIYSFRDNKRDNYYLISIFFVISLHLIFVFLWRHLIPHNSTPDNFILLKFELSMLSYYMRTWTFYFLPFLAYIFCFGFLSFYNTLKSKYVLPLTIVSLSMAILAFLYQWPDARFTYIFWPWVVLIFSLYISQYSTKVKLIYCIFFTLSILIVPKSYWGPALSDSRISLSSTWFSEYLNTKSTNRDIGFPGINENNSKFFASADGYLRAVLTFYSNVKSD
jgi:hypothetical protein